MFVNRLTAKSLLAMMCLAGMTACACAAEGDEALATVAPASDRGDYFGEQTATLEFQCSAVEAIQGKVLWQYSAGARTLARGEDPIQIAAGQERVYKLPIEFPPVNEGVIFETQVEVTIVNRNNETIARCEQPIWLFPEDPYAQRRQWLEQLDLHLYDPEETTSKLFEKAKIPHELVTNSNVLVDFDGDILIVGSGVSFRRNRALTDHLLMLAKRGVKVLCLSPVDGELPWPAREEYPQMADVRFSTRQVIRDVDKHLTPDFDSAVQEPEVGYGVMLESYRGQLRVTMSDNPSAWAWWQVRFHNQGTCILCCFDLVPHWDDSPTPRFFLARLLEHLSPETNPSPLEQ